VRRLLHDAQWWPTRQILLDARGTTPADMDRFLDQLVRVRPALLVGYVEGVTAFARHVRARAVALPPLTAVSVTASVLHAGQRDLIEAVLGAPVYDTYRSAEVPWIAAECADRSGLHVLADHRRLEIVDAAGTPVDDGDTGDVLLTDLSNRAFPLIRYAIGDRTRWVSGACACGRGLPRIAPIEGRVVDVLRTRSGRLVSGGLSTLFLAHPGTIAQFQIHQSADYSVVVRYVSVGDVVASAAAAQDAVVSLAAFLGHEVPVTAQAVSAIDNVGGKARLVVSEVAG
jgi:phenylacetate-CoA ligase